MSHARKPRTKKPRLVRVGTRGTIYDVHCDGTFWGWIICSHQGEWAHCFNPGPFVRRKDVIADLLTHQPYKPELQ